MSWILANKQWCRLIPGVLFVLLSGCGPNRDSFTAAPRAPVENRVVIEKEVPVPVPADDDKKIVVLPPAKHETNKIVKEKEKVVVAAPEQPSTPPEKKPASAKPRPKPTSRSARTQPKPKATKIASAPKPTRARPTPTSKPAASSKDNAGLVVQGEVVQTSKVPDPKSVPYKESLVFIKYKVLSVQRGEYKESEILVAHWGMKDKKLLPAARYRTGEMRRLVLEPLDNHAELESVMRNDDTQAWELTPYLATATS